MTEFDVANALLALGIVIGLSHILGYVFDKLKQPRLVGEIVSGILLGPFVFALIAPTFFETYFHLTGPSTDTNAVVFSFLYWLGLIMLMFLSGSQVRNLLSNENHKATAYILLLGKPLAFLIVLVLGLLSLLPLDSLMGSESSKIPILLILCCAVAVTSIPVISRIFQDIGIMHTRFASLVLGIAVLEDIVLWAILAVATAYVTSPSESIYMHIGLSLLYLLFGLLLFPKVLTKLSRSKRNILMTISPIAYSMVVLSAFVGLAGALGVNLIFAAFLAGYGLVGGAKGENRKYFDDALTVIHKFSYAVLIPVYFTLVGYKLVFNQEFSFTMLAVFLIGSSAIAILSVGLAAQLAGFNRLETANLAITLNARGGPGIVLASIAYETNIINAAFYTTLVLTALITSMLAGSWLRAIRTRNLPLLSGE